MSGFERPLAAVHRRRSTTTSPRAAAATTPSSARSTRDASAARTACRARTPTLVAFLVENHLAMSPRGAEAGRARPRGGARLRRARRQRAPPGRALPPDRGRHPRHQPEGVERAGRRSCWRTCSAPRAACSPATPLARDAALAEKQAEAARLLRPLRALRRGARSASGRSSTPPTSCATTRRRSPGRRATCTTASTADKPVVKARLAPFGEGLQVMIYTPRPRGAVRAHLRLLRARRLQHRRSEGPHHAQRLRARHLPGHGPGRAARTTATCMSCIETELAARAAVARRRSAPPRGGRLSRRVRHFPISPAVDIRPDERGAYQVLSIVAADRPGPALRRRAHARRATTSTCRPRASTRSATAPRTCSWCQARRWRTRRRCCSSSRSCSRSCRSSACCLRSAR